jgi:hypothetical protein
MQPTPQRISFQDRALCQRTFGVRAQERQYHRLFLGEGPGMTLPRQHADLLGSYGATASEVEELLAYNDNVFDRSFARAPTLPLPAEPHVAAWERYAREVTEIGAFKALQRRLVQLRFPIRKGISNTDAYRAATLRGTSTQGMTEASGLNLANPDDLRLRVHPSPAGPIPVLTPGGREDFVALVRALTRKNEPAPVPESMGACMVAGFNNWDRIREYRRRWEEEGGDRSEAAWQEEFRRLVPRKGLYQDRFLILSTGPYSNVAAGEIGLSSLDWRETSTTIRLEHECTHYFTLRVFGSMRNNLFDELIADYMGITAAAGRYRADWFLRFMGLESFPAYREGGRLQNYRGRPPLSEGAFGVLRALVRNTAENLRRASDGLGFLPGTPEERAGVLLALCSFRMEDLAAPDAPAIVSEAVRREAGRFRDKTDHTPRAEDFSSS